VKEKSRHSLKRRRNKGSKMKKIILALVCSLPLHSSAPVEQSLQQPVSMEQIQPAQPVVKTITQEEWLANTQKLNNESQEKIINFLGSICKVYPDLKTDRREAIDNTINDLLAHTQNQIEKIKRFVHLERLISKQEKSFSLEKLIQSSTNSQGTDRANMSMALREIMIDDPRLLKTIKQIDNSMKYSSAEHVTEAVEETDLFLQVIRDFQKLMENDVDGSAELCVQLKNKLENGGEDPEIQAQALSAGDLTFSAKLYGLWNSIVRAFEKHY
jgi:hypothetical protein